MQVPTPSAESAIQTTESIPRAPPFFAARNFWYLEQLVRKHAKTVKRSRLRAENNWP